MGLAIVCPLTNADRKIPFHLPIPATTGLTGFVMVEQVKSMDFAAREMRFIAKVSAAFVEEVLRVIEACIGEPS